MANNQFVHLNIHFTIHLLLIGFYNPEWPPKLTTLLCSTWQHCSALHWSMHAAYISAFIGNISYFNLFVPQQIWRLWDHASWYISIVQPTRCTMFRVYLISLYMFWMVFPSIIRSSRLYIQHQVYVTQVHWLHAVCTVLNSWWWMERPSKTCRVIFNKIEKLCI